MKTHTTEDHASMADAIRSLTDRGFVRASYVDEHYRHPDQCADSYWTRADVFTFGNKNIARIYFWQSIA
jgi:hypothetical protein